MVRIDELEVEQRGTDLTSGSKHAIVLTANSFRFGGNWGFLLSDKPDTEEIVALLRAEHPNVKVIPVMNGYLILTNPDFLAYNINKLVPDAIDRTFVERVSQRRAEEKERFQKFVQNVAKGKSSHLRSGNGHYELTVGIFSFNETNLIRINGEDFPAFKLTLIEALEYLHQLNQQGIEVHAAAIDKDGAGVIDDVFRLASNSSGTQALYRALEIASSETGVFLRIFLR